MRNQVILDGICNNPLCLDEALLVPCLGFVSFWFWNFIFDKPLQIMFFQNEHDPIFPCSEIISSLKLFVKLGAQRHLVLSEYQRYVKTKRQGFTSYQFKMSFSMDMQRQGSSLQRLPLPPKSLAPPCRILLFVGRQVFLGGALALPLEVVRASPLARVSPSRNLLGLLPLVFRQNSFLALGLGFGQEP